MFNLIPCENKFTIEDKVSDEVMKRQLVLDFAEKIRDKYPTLSSNKKLLDFVFSERRDETIFNVTNDTKDWMDGKKWYFKVTDGIYLKKTLGEITMLLFEFAVTRGNWFPKDRFNSAEWNKVVSIIDVTEKTFNVTIDSILIYSVKPFFKKPIKFNYAESLNLLPFKAIDKSTKFRTADLRNKTKLTETDNENDYQFGLWCKGCSKLKSCNKDSSGMLGLNNATIETKLTLIENQITLESLSTVPSNESLLSSVLEWDKQKNRLIDMVSMEEQSFKDNPDKKFHVFDEFYSWTETNVIPFEKSKVGFYDFETTRTYMPILTEFTGLHQVPLVVSVNNQIYISPYLTDEKVNKFTDYNQINWIEKWVSRLASNEANFVYNKTFELGVLKQTLKWLDNLNKGITLETKNTQIQKLKVDIQKVIDNTIDLADPFSKKLIILKGLLGGWSLKKVLEPFVGYQPYGKNKLINNGEDAMLLMKELIYSRMFKDFNTHETEEQKRQVQSDVLSDLETYCNTDTLELETLFNKFIEIYHSRVKTKDTPNSK